MLQLMNISENTSQLYACLMLFMKMLFAGYFHSHSKVRLFCWFNVFPIHSVHNWSQFKKLFKNSFDNYDPIKIHNNLYEMQVNDGESINDFNIRFRQVFLSLHEKHRPSTDIMLEWYVQSLPKDMAMFILQKGITDLHEACEYALKLEKDFKMYSSESFPSFSLYDEMILKMNQIFQNYLS